MAYGSKVGTPPYTTATTTYHQHTPPPLPTPIHHRVPLATRGGHLVQGLCGSGHSRARSLALLWGSGAPAHSPVQEGAIHPYATSSAYTIHHLTPYQDALTHFDALPPAPAQPLDAMASGDDAALAPVDVAPASAPSSAARAADSPERIGVSETSDDDAFIVPPLAPSPRCSARVRAIHPYTTSQAYTTLCHTHRLLLLLPNPVVLLCSARRECRQQLNRSSESRTAAAAAAALRRTNR